jgi:hypothetical protein
MSTEQQEELQGEYVDAVDEMAEAWEAFQEAYRTFRKVQDRIHPTEGRTWHAYHDAQVQGEERGWLGGPFLADMIDSIREAVG